jgi:hypothetical protein
VKNSVVCSIFSSLVGLSKTTDSRGNYGKKGWKKRVLGKRGRGMMFMQYTDITIINRVS